MPFVHSTPARLWPCSGCWRPPGLLDRAWPTRLALNGLIRPAPAVLPAAQKGCSHTAIAAEGLYLPESKTSFKPPYAEAPGNPLFAPPESDPNGYENCGASSYQPTS